MAKDVFTPSDEVVAMQADWDLVEDLLGGTSAMRAAGTKHMPKRSLEEPDDYNARLELATLFPAFEETLGVMTGRVFAKTVQLSDKVPAWMRDEVLDDVDFSGRNFHAFLRAEFYGSLSHGLRHVLVDAPEAGPNLTIEQAKAQRIRPYLVPIHPRRVLGWKHRAGQLVQVRILFTERVDDGPFHSKMIDECHVFELIAGRVTRTIFQKNNDGKAVEVRSNVMDARIKRIPLVTFYTGRTGLMTATPPLRELAHLNVKHWRMQSSNESLIETASVPILAAIGLDDDKQTIVIGTKFAVRLPTGADLKFVEHTGKAIEAGRNNLDSIKEEMKTAGAKLLTKAQGTKTATQASEEASRENSALGSMVEDTQDSAIDLLDVIAMFRGEASGGDLEIRANLDPDLSPVESMTVLGNMADRGRLSDETLFEEAKRRGLLAEDRTWADELQRIEETQGRLDPPSPGNLPPGKPGDSPGAGGDPGDEGGTGSAEGGGGAQAGAG
jgi:hypothetical protein